MTSLLNSEDLQNKLAALRLYFHREQLYVLLPTVKTSLGQFMPMLVFHNCGARC